MFRTYALDLGLYTNAMYQYVHGILPDHSMIDANGGNPLLAAHFDLYLILFSPLTFLFGNWTLLIIQWFAVLVGGWGIVRIFNNEKSRQVLALLFYFLFFGVIGAFGYDAHSNVIAASLIPWYYYYLTKNDKLKSWLILLLMLISKENAGLWLFFFQFTLYFEWKDKLNRRLVLIQSVTSITYFLVVIKLFMPGLSSSESYVGLLYGEMGSTLSEVFLNTIVHPIDALSLIITDGSNFSAIKLEFLFSLVASGMFFVYKKPHFLIILGFLIVQKLWHDNSQLWGVNGHYNIEFASIFTIMIFTSLKGPIIKSEKYLLGLLFIGTLTSTIHSLDITFAVSDKSALRFYQKQHYNRHYDVGHVKDELRKIPNEATVSALSPFVPHFSMRINVYQFPVVNNAEYVVLSNDENSYPLKQTRLEHEIDLLSKSPQWDNISKLDNLYIFKRNSK